ncbi:MAG TPA: hypothetical protein VFI11_00245, partial [Anaerolineales bacterium]|nr:hypothetical protein [Anaerolineales bacterium]
HLLQLEILDLTTNQPLDQAYCYLSHEFAAREHARLPEDEDAFLSQDEGGWNIEDYAAGPHRAVFTHDLDQPIPVAMECWGWAGAELVNLGSFRNSHPRSDWESVLPVRFTGAGEGFEAVYSIGPFSGELRPLLYEYDCPSRQDRMVAPSGGDSECDTTIPAPYNVRLATDGLPPEASPAEQAQACAQGHTSLEGGTTLGGAGVAALACGWPSRTVVWEWDGDRSQIEGFHVSFEYSTPSRVFYGGLGRLRRYEVTLGSMAQLFPIPGRVSCEESLTVRVYAFGYEHYPPDTPHYSEGGAIPDPPDDYFIRTSPNSRPYRVYGPPCPQQAQAQLVLGNLHVDHSRDVDGLEVLCFFCEEDHTQEAYGVLELDIEADDGTRQTLAVVNLWDSEDPRSIGNGNHPLDEEEFEICKLVQGVQPLRMRCHQFPAQLSFPGFAMYLDEGDRLVATLVLKDADGSTGDDVWCNGITQSPRYTARGWAQADVSISVDNATEVLRGDEDVSCFLGMHIEGLGLTGGVTPAP